MNQRGPVWVVILLVAAGLVAGCHSDPNVRKQKYLESGKRYSTQGKYREAAIQFSNALKIDKNYPDAHYQLSQAYVHLGQYGAAYSELKRTVDLQPTNYKARIDLGNLLLAGGKTDDAQAQANAVLAAEPNNPDLHQMLSAIAIRRGQKDVALTEIHRALELDPGRAAFHENLALLQSNDPSMSSSVEEELKKAVALDAKSVNAKLMLAAFYIRGSRWPEAEKACRDAISTDPKSISARAALAQVFLKQGNQAQAEQILRQASQDLADNPQGVRMLADYYATSGQLNKAKAEFQNLAAKYPKNVSVQKGYIRVLLETKDYGTAQTVVSGLMKKNAKDPEVAGLNGIVLLNAGKTNDAVNALQTAVKDAPKDAFLQYWLGKAALAKGDIDLGETSLRQAATLNPSSLPAEEELARIAGQRGDMNLLADVAAKTIAAAPRFPAGYVWRAAVEMNQNSADKAEADLKTAMSVAPQSPQAYLALGKIRFTQKRYPEGVALLEQALQYDPNSYDALRLIVAYDLNEKQADKGMARLNAQIEKSPKNSGFLDLLAQLQIRNKNLDQAFATAQKAIQLNPGDGEAVMLFAQVEVARGQTASALNAWQQWSKAHPNDAGADAILGTLEESRGDMNDAEAYYRKALQIQPQQPIAANNLAYRMLVNGENVDVALTLAQTARRAMPNSASTADTLAWAYYYKGTYGFARDLLEDAVKTEPNDASMQYHLGMVYSKLRDKNSAETHLKKAVSLAPNSPTAKDAKAALQGLG
ncbi:MAG TPA: tetratricopeptide repeat protein [Terracidiphilus sp.]|jgi:tetratricopeptide (TPR) repeat protein